MSPLSIVKYIVEHLQGTPYEPWVNGLLFLLFFTAIFAVISLMLGRGGRKFIAKAASVATDKLKNRKGYAPEWEAFRLRTEPYVELVGSLYFAFVGLYSATVVGLALVLNVGRAQFWPFIVGTVWVLASFFYMRVNLEAASWAYHNIKKRRG